jgi:DNA-binding beta-propeller fold protein YncE
MASGRRERFDGSPCDRKFSPACSWRANTGSVSNGQNAASILGRTNVTSNGGSGVNQSLLHALESVSSDPTNDRLFVTDSGNNRVLVFNVAKIINSMNASKVLGQVNFTTRDSYTTQSGCNNPHQVFYDRGSGRLFVSDYNNHRVMIFEGDARHPNFIKVMFP